MCVPIFISVFFLVGSLQIDDFCFPKKLFKSHDYYIYTDEVFCVLLCTKVHVFQVPSHFPDKINSKLYLSNSFSEAVCSFAIQIDALLLNETLLILITSVNGRAVSSVFAIAR